MKLYLDLTKVTMIFKQLREFDHKANSHQVYSYARRHGIILTSYECITVSNLLTVERL